jgi:hypothetical protein
MLHECARPAPLFKMKNKGRGAPHADGDEAMIVMALADQLWFKA